MQVFRISKTRYINDLSGTGARLNGGRWNFPGINILYTSESRALATVEFLVHASAGIMPQNLSIATLEIPNRLQSSDLSVTDLPDNWREHPSPLFLAEIGTTWAQANTSLFLRVPSAVVEHDYNILINPAHPDMQHVQIVDVEPYLFDVRLIR